MKTAEKLMKKRDFIKVEMDKVIEDGAINACAVLNPKLQKIMKIPGMATLAVKMWDPITKKKFGPSCGFQNK